MPNRLPSLAAAMAPDMRGLTVDNAGLDSAALAYWLRARGARLRLLSFDYGQCHRIELDHAVGITVFLRLS